MKTMESEFTKKIKKKGLMILILFISIITLSLSMSSVSAAVDFETYTELSIDTSKNVVSDTEFNIEGKLLNTSSSPVKGIGGQTIQVDIDGKTYSGVTADGTGFFSVPVKVSAFDQIYDAKIYYDANTSIKTSPAIANMPIDVKNKDKKLSTYFDELRFDTTEERLYGRLMDENGKPANKEDVENINILLSTTFTTAVLHYISDGQFYIQYGAFTSNNQMPNVTVEFKGNTTHYGANLTILATSDCAFVLMFTVTGDIDSINPEFTVSGQVIELTNGLPEYTNQMGKTVVITLTDLNGFEVVENGVIGVDGKFTVSFNQLAYGINYVNVYAFIDPWKQGWNRGQQINSTIVVYAAKTKTTTTIEFDHPLNLKTKESIISGVLLDANNQPLKDQYLTLIINGKTYTNVKTDGNGRFEIKDIFETFLKEITIYAFYDGMYTESDGTENPDKYYFFDKTITTLVDIPDSIVTITSIGTGQDHINDTITVLGTLTEDDGTTPIPFADVEIYIDNVYYTTATTNALGEFNFTIRKEKAGNYLIKGVYGGQTVGGNPTIRGHTSNEEPFEVLKHDTKITLINLTEFIFNHEVTLEAKLTNEHEPNKPPIGGAWVELWVDNGNGFIYYGRGRTDSNGEVIFKYTLGDTPCEFEVRFAEDQNYLKSSNKILGTPRPIYTYIVIDHEASTKPFRNFKITITLYDEFGQLVRNQDGINVVLSDGTQYNNLKTGSNGKISIFYPPQKAGTIGIKAEFMGTSLFHPSSETSSFVVNLLETMMNFNNLLVHALKDATLSGILVDEEGRLFPSNVINTYTVDIYIDGVYFNTYTTDAFSRIKDIIGRLSVGDYTITAIFAGVQDIWAASTTTAILTVRPVITTTIVTVEQKEDGTVFIAKLLDEFNNPLANVPMAFFLNGEFIGVAITNNDGVAMLPYSLTLSGKITAEFLGDNIYSESNGNQVLGASNIPNKIDKVNNTKVKNTTSIIKHDNGKTDKIPNDIVKETKNNDIEESDIDGQDNEHVSGIIMYKTGNPIAILLLFILLIGILFIDNRKKHLN